MNEDEQQQAQEQEQCNVESTFTHTYETNHRFENTKSILLGHYGSPRFGHTSEIATLIDGAKYEKRDYLVGLVSSNIAMMSVFTIWSLPLLYLKRLGPSKVNGWSGQMKISLPKQSPSASSKSATRIIPTTTATQEVTQHEESDYGYNNHDNTNGTITTNTSSDLDAVTKDSLILTATNSTDTMVSSYQQQRQHHPQDEEQDKDLLSTRNEEEWDDLSSSSCYKMQKRRHLWVRAVAGCSCLAVIMSALLMSIKGVSTLQTTIEVSFESFDIFQELTHGAILLMDELLDSKYDGSSHSNISTADNYKNNWNHSSAIIDDNINDTVQIEDVENDFNNILIQSLIKCNGESNNTMEGGNEDNDRSMQIEFILGYLKFKRNQFWRNMTRTKADLESILEITNDIEQTIYEYMWAFQIARIFGLLLGFLSFCILLGVMFHHRFPRLLRCLQHWLVVPSFCVLVVMTGIFALLFVIGSIATSDFCIDDPDTRIETTIRYFESEISQVSSDYLYFYADRKSLNTQINLFGNGPDIKSKDIRPMSKLVAYKAITPFHSLFSCHSDCPLDAAPTILTDYIEALTWTSNEIKQFVTEEKADNSQAMNDPVTDNINSTWCGLSEQLLDGLSVAAQQLCVTAGLVDDLGHYLQCKRWYPLVSNTVYDFLCYAGSEGLVWVSTTAVHRILCYGHLNVTISLV